MRKFLPLIILLFLGCQSTPAIDPYVVKENKSWPYTIQNPYAWSRIQISEAAPIGQNRELCKAEVDIDSDQELELLIRADIPARNYLVLVFRRTANGYRYIKHTESIVLKRVNWTAAPDQ